jgi:hypothetical protein
LMPRPLLTMVERKYVCHLTQLLTDPARFSSSVSSYSCTWFRYQFSSKFPGEWNDFAFVSWAGITWFWKPLWQT